MAMRERFRRLIDQVGLAYGPRQGEVGLLVIPDEDLQSVQFGILALFVHRMHNRLDGMLFAPDGWGHDSGFFPQLDGVDEIPARAFDGRDVETQRMPSLLRTSDMD